MVKDVSTLFRSLILVGVVSSGGAWAAGPFYDTIYDNGKFAVLNGYMTEHPLTSSGSASNNFQVSMPAGYANAEIFLTSLYCI